MAKKNKSTLVGFATLVSESEWTKWESSLYWVPVRPVVPLKQLFGKKVSYFSKLRDGIDPSAHPFIAVFETPSGKCSKSEKVPFYRTTRILSLSEGQEGVLRSRYSSIVDVSLLPTSARDAYDTWHRDFRRRAMEQDSSLGGEKICEMLKFELNEEIPFPISSLCSVLQGEKPADVPKEVRAMLSYSRHSNFPETLVGAMCDLGAILRSCADTELEKEVVSAFAAVMGGVVKGGAPCGTEELLKVLDDFSGKNPFFSVRNVLYLYWRYRAEQNNGEIPFESIDNDIQALSGLLPTRDPLSYAAWLLGAVAGFSAFAPSYHMCMRESLKCSKGSLPGDLRGPDGGDLQESVKSEPSLPRRG